MPCPRRPDRRADRRRARARAAGRALDRALLPDEALHERLVRVVRKLRYDHRELALALREHHRRTRQEGERPIAFTSEDRDNMHMLHALRIGLIQKLILLAVHLPAFSARHGVMRDTLIHRLVHLDVPAVLDELSEIFPLQEKRVADLDFGEPATWRDDANQGYAEEHRTLFRPLGAIYELIRRIGSGVMHNVGTLG